MDSPQIALVQASFPRVYARKGEIASRFYDRLFAELPEVEGWFHGDSVKQKDMFAKVLSTSMQLLSNPERFAALGVELADRHKNLNLQEAHLNAARQALIDALDETSGTVLSEAEAEAWHEGISLLIHLVAGADQTERQTYFISR